jgi:hypothetical protein
MASMKRHLIVGAVVQSEWYLLPPARTAMPEMDPGHAISNVLNPAALFFKGMVIFFLLDTGMHAGRLVGLFKKTGAPLVIFGLVAPLVSGALGLLVARAIGMAPGDALLFVILCASASYIVAPAAMRHAIPESNPGLVELLSLGITFPFNITVGIPLYWAAIRWMWGS